MQYQESDSLSLQRWICPSSAALNTTRMLVSHLHGKVEKRKRYNAIKILGRHYFGGEATVRGVYKKAPIPSLSLYSSQPLEMNHSYSTDNPLLRMAALTVIPYIYKPPIIRRMAPSTKLATITRLPDNILQKSDKDYRNKPRYPTNLNNSTMHDGLSSSQGRLATPFPHFSTCL